jgi:hypothetical protein
MIDYEAEIRHGLESHLAATTLATTGALTDVSVAGSIYTRASGSFIDDGFAAGDQLFVTGFTSATNNGWSVVTAVAAGTLTVDRVLATEAAGDTVTIKSVLPRSRKFPGQVFDIPPDKPWIRATLRPSGMPIAAIGDGPRIRHMGLFIIDVFHPYDTGTGLAHAERIAGAIRQQFKVPTTISRQSGLVIRITEVQPGSLIENSDFLQLNPGASYFADAPW